jgi:hypothetical protein
VKEQKEIPTLCDFEQCPVKDTCAFFCPTMDKTKTRHWGIYPYEIRKGKCYEKRELDIIKLLLNYKQ